MPAASQSLHDLEHVAVLLVGRNCGSDLREEANLETRASRIVLVESHGLLATRNGSTSEDVCEDLTVRCLREDRSPSPLCGLVRSAAQVTSGLSSTASCDGSSCGTELLGH